MSKVISKVDSSDIYQTRFKEYRKRYVETCPEPPDPMLGKGGGQALASVKKKGQNDKNNQNHKTSSGDKTYAS
jgi:hypothetical protein